MKLSTRIDSELQKLAKEAAAQVGLEVSDLIRAGLHAVCAEITATGMLRVFSSAACAPKPFSTSVVACGPGTMMALPSGLQQKKS